MKKILTLLALASALGLSSCSDLTSAGGDLIGTVFEGSISVDNATIVSATDVKTRSSVTDIGVKNSRGAAKVDSFTGAGNRYQTVTVKGGGYTLKGDIPYTGTFLYSGMKGTMRVGKKSGTLKGFDPTY